MPAGEPATIVPVVPLPDTVASPVPLHTPPDVLSLSKDVEPPHILLVAPIAAGTALIVTVFTAEQPDPIV